MVFMDESRSGNWAATEEVCCYQPVTASERNIAASREHVKIRDSDGRNQGAGQKPHTIHVSMEMQPR